MSFLNLGNDEPAHDGSMFGPRLGTWSVASKLDPRWNKTGRSYGLVMSGGPAEISAWVDHAATLYGEKPADLEVAFMKD